MVAFVRQTDATDLTYTLVASPSLVPWKQQSLDGQWLDAGSTTIEEGLSEQVLTTPGALDSGSFFVRVQVSHTR